MKFSKILETAIREEIKDFYRKGGGEEFVCLADVKMSHAREDLFKLATKIKDAVLIHASIEYMEAGDVDNK